MERGAPAGADAAGLLRGPADSRAATLADLAALRAAVVLRL
jgi:hypothetical protein